MLREHSLAFVRPSQSRQSLSENAAQIILANWNKDWDMPREMTALPKKLKQGGYATHMVGKVRTAARLLPAPD